MKKRGFSLVELMVVVAIIAILASIALPMYNKFRRNSNAKSVLSPCNGMKAGLVTYYLGDEQNEGSFTGMSRDGTTGGLQKSSSFIGVGLPAMANVTWTFSAPASNRLSVSWVISTCSTCNGRWCLECNREAGACYVAVQYSNNAFTKYNYNDASITCAAP